MRQGCDASSVRVRDRRGGRSRIARERTADLKDRVPERQGASQRSRRSSLVACRVTSQALGLPP